MDVGIETLGRIHATLQIDEEWTARRPHGFTWWGHRLAHCLDVGPGVDNDGIVLFPLTSRISVVRNVEADDATVEAVLGQVNVLASTNCYVYESVRREVQSVQRGIIHAQTLDWRSKSLGARFIIQLCMAEAAAGPLATGLSGEVACSAHPAAGRREVPDDMLNVVDAFFRPEGLQPSRFLGVADFKVIAAQASGPSGVSFGASDDGVAVEVPFGTDTALIGIRADDPHPQLGSGLGVFVRLPIMTDKEECARFANWLNRREADPTVRYDMDGAWCVKQSGNGWMVCHAQYIPNALYQPGIAYDAVGRISRKLECLNRLVNPEVEVPDVREIVSKRLEEFARIRAFA